MGDEMSNIVLLSCSSKKKDYNCISKEMYSASPIFSRAYKYAKLIGDKVFILSAKFGLLQEDDIIEPYNFTLINQSNQYRKE